MHKINNWGGKLFAGIMTLAIAAGAAWGALRDAQPKFHDATMTVGGEFPQLVQYLNDPSLEEKCGFVTDLASLDVSTTGERAITLSHGARRETVTLHIEDTVAPELEVRNLQVPLGTELTPGDFVVRLWDHSQAEVAFASEIQIPSDYAPAAVTLIATDAHGNTTTATSYVSFDWLRPEVTLEHGLPVTREAFLLNPEADAALIPDSTLNLISSAPVGEYQIPSISGDRILVCNVTVQDTTGPVVELQEYRVRLRESAELEDFVVSATDISGNVTLTMLSEPDFTVAGIHTIVIEARDIYGNVTTAETLLYVAADSVPPVIRGANNPLTVEKHSDPDYLNGVSAYDTKDGSVTVTVDSSKVDTSVAGTYFVTYSAKDSFGNVSTVRRKVNVEHDEEDTQALVQSIADTLGNDPEKIRDYVRSSISYSHSWGGDDPIWTGFTNKHGNCYVHALCLKAILDVKGFNTQLIWVTNKTHYWLIIEIEPGVWRHIDPTPSNTHGRYSLMTDNQRLSTLSGRNWNHDNWPACE